MKRTLALIAISTALTGCGSIGSTPGNAASTPASASAPASPSSPSCASQGTAWATGGGKSEVDAVATDLGNIQTAGSALGAAITDGSAMTGPESRLQACAVPEFAHCL